MLTGFVSCQAVDSSTDIITYVCYDVVSIAGS